MVSNTKRFSSPKNGKERRKYYYFHYTSCMVLVGRGILCNYYSPVGSRSTYFHVPLQGKNTGGKSPSSIVQLVQGIISMANFSSANKENHAYIQYTQQIQLYQKEYSLIYTVDS
jgi:hypothetical protein